MRDLVPRWPGDPARQSVILGLVLLAGALAGFGGSMWVVAALVATGLGFLAYAAPGVLLAAYVAIPFYKGALQPFSPVDVTVVLAALNGASLLPLIMRQTALRRSAAVLWVATAVLVVGGVAWAMEGNLALGTAAGWLGLVAVPMVAAIRVSADPGGARSFVVTLAMFSVAFVGLGALALLGSGSGDRLLLLGANTIGVARAACLLPVIGAAYLTASGPRSIRWPLIALGPPAIVVAIASGSRGPVLFAIVVVAAGAISVGIRNGGIGHRRTVGVSVLGALAAVGVVALLPELPVASLLRFEDLLTFVLGTRGEGDTSTAARLTLFDAAWQMFASKPLFGWGTAGFAWLSPLDEALRGNTYPHNVLLQFAAEFGVIGLILAVGLFLVALNRRLPADPMWHAIRYIFVFWLMNAMISGDIYSDRMLWGLTLLLAFRPNGPQLTVDAKARSRLVAPRGWTTFARAKVAPASALIAPASS